MKKLIAVVLMLLFASVVHAQVKPTYSAGYLAYDKGYSPIQGHASDPAKDSAPVTINAGGTTFVTVTGWMSIKWYTTGDVQVYLNDQTTKYFPYAGNEWHGEVIHPSTTKFHFKNPGAAAVTLYYRGM